MHYELRPATQADHDFIFRVKATSLKPYVAAIWGWNDDFQQDHFTDHFDPAYHQIIVVEQREIGDLSLRYLEQEIHLDGIYISPPFQRKGIGSAIIEDLILEGKRSGRPLKLQVLISNPARRLYERLGFTIDEQTETHFIMSLVP